LGNKGNEYNNTRHNIGFMAIDKILEYYNINTIKNKYDGIYYELILNSEKKILFKPQKNMNLSGEVISKYINFFKIDIKDVLIISDDLDLPLGKIKIKYKGSPGGHNGLKNIEKELQTSEYKRIKIGISNNKNIDTKNYVLGKLTKEELDEINKTINLMPEILNYYLNNSFEKLMTKYN